MFKKSACSLVVLITCLLLLVIEGYPTLTLADPISTKKSDLNTVRVYDFNTMPFEKLSDKISRLYVYGKREMFVYWKLKKGAVIPLHHHASEQITYILKGKVVVNIGTKQYIIDQGGVIIIPANVPHQFTVLEDTLDLDMFSPIRKDWLDGTADYLQEVKAQ